MIAPEIEKDTDHAPIVALAMIFVIAVHVTNCNPTAQNIKARRSCLISSALSKSERIESEGPSKLYVAGGC
jgi:hypothetical protein